MLRKSMLEMQLTKGLTNLNMQWRKGKLEPGKVQYSTTKFFDKLFLIRAYWKQKSRQGPILGCLGCWGGPNNFISIFRTYDNIFWNVVSLKSLDTYVLNVWEIQRRIFKDFNPIVKRSKNAWIMVMLRLVGSHWQYFILSILDL